MKTKKKCYVSFKDTVEFKHEETCFHTLSLVLNKISPRKIITTLGVLCMNKGLPYTSSMLGLLAGQDEVDMVEGMVILMYITHHWKKILKDASKYWKKNFPKWEKDAIERRKRNENK